MPRIRNKTYTSLVELNRDLREWQNKKNSEVMKDRGNSRYYFFEKEKELLNKLPLGAYDFLYFKKAKIHPDCHFQHQRNFYSVPYNYVGKEIEVKYNGKTVHAYFNTIRIASHAALIGHAHYSTIDNHYPEGKIVEISYHLSKARIETRKIGPHMEALIETLIRMDRFPLKTLRKVQGVLSLKSSFNNDALNSAAELSLEFNRLTYTSVKSFAKHYRPNNTKNNEAPIRSANLICLHGGANE